MTEDHSYCSH